MKAKASPFWDHETRLLAWLAACVSVFTFLFYYRSGGVLLYGDAVAHINIARRIFDSKTPGLLQLGTVWLPLPHLLMVPFLLSDKMWQSGAGGSIPSMAAYVFSVIGIVRLVRGLLSHDGSARGSAIAAWGAAIVFAANPNLIYLQSTAMTEVLYIAFFIWATYYFSEFVRGDSKALTKCGFCLAAACLTRYDGWFLAGMMAALVLLASARKFQDRELRRVVLKFIVIAAVGPVFWLAYNAAVYRNPLEFANGPYSPRAIALKTGTVNPAAGSVSAGAAYFLKAAELNVAQTTWVQRVWLILAAIGLLAVRADWRRLWPVLLLAIPLPFYALSLAYGGVPIFLPTWWPFSHYNVRYGLQLLPMLVVFGALGFLLIVQTLKSLGSPGTKFFRWIPVAVAFAMLVLVATSYVEIWRAQPISYREAAINSRSRLALEKQVAGWVTPLPPSSTILMYVGEHVGALQQAGIPLRRVIDEGNHRVWKQPADSEGLWERALADPSALADFAVAFEGDPVWNAARDRHFPELVEVETTGQPRAVIYKTR